MGDRRYKISDLVWGVGISRSTATKLYHGGTDVNLSVVDRVCRALDADLCELFEYVPDGDGEIPEGGVAEAREPAAANRP
jgi:DNA-binding Xre family transcriptional regulator